MGARGFLGFVIDDQEKIAYNHSDSYPDGLGVDVLTWLRGIAEFEPNRDLKAEARALEVVAHDRVPTAEEVERLEPWTDRNVGSRDEFGWYQLLRNTQGSPEETLQAGFMLDGSNFPLDSLFAEWGYVIDLDTETFEVYRGFQHEPHSKGRFAERMPREGRSSSLSGGHYYPVALVASWPLADLPDEEAFLATFRAEGEDD